MGWTALVGSGFLGAILTMVFNLWRSHRKSRSARRFIEGELLRNNDALGRALGSGPPQGQPLPADFDPDELQDDQWKAHAERLHDGISNYSWEIVHQAYQAIASAKEKLKQADNVYSPDVMFEIDRARGRIAHALRQLASRRPAILDPNVMPALQPRSARLRDNVARRWFALRMSESARDEIYYAVATYLAIAPIVFIILLIAF